MGESLPARLGIVIPAWNEAHRFDPEPFRAFVDAHADVRLLLVDDGSRDGTADRLAELAASRPDAITVLTLAQNVGKGEAVRRGLLHLLDTGLPLVGYLDADLAAPLAAMQLLADDLRHHDQVHLVFGSRVKLLGWQIRRSERRHYLGRIFATCASLALGLAVYDTQCGAKVMRNSDPVRSALAQPFLSRWLFDVELIARLRNTAGVAALREMPIPTWADADGSSLRLRDFARAPWQLWRIWRTYPWPR